MNVYEIVTGKLIAALERGTVPWRRPGGCPDMDPVRFREVSAVRMFHATHGAICIAVVQLPDGRYTVRESIGDDARRAADCFDHYAPALAARERIAGHWRAALAAAGRLNSPNITGQSAGEGA